MGNREQVCDLDSAVRLPYPYVKVVTEYQTDIILRNISLNDSLLDTGWDPKWEYIGGAIHWPSGHLILS